MLKIAELGADTAAWDRFVDAHPQATFFHRSTWRDVIAKAFGHRTHYLVAEQDGAIAGVLPLAQVKTRLFGNTLISLPFCVYGGPLSLGNAAADALAAHAAALGLRLGAAATEFRFLNNPGSWLSDAGWQKRDGLYVTFRRAIAADDDANLKAIPRKQRAMVRKGIDRGLQAEHGRDTGLLHTIYAESVRNLGTPVFSRRYFRLLAEAFGADMDVTTIRDAGTPVAAVMNFYWRGEVIPYYGGGTAAARGCHANDFMYWAVMRAAAARGCRLFDFGRSKTGTGAFAFKKNWGFEPQPLSYFFNTAPGRAIPENNPLNPKYRLLIAGWKKIAASSRQRDRPHAGAWRGMTAGVRPALWPVMTPVLPAVAAALLALAALFYAEIGAAVHVWNTSTAYGHCWLVLPIVLWLLHERRFQGTAVPSRPSWWPVVPAVALTAAWVGADILGIMEGRQLALIGFVELSLIAVLGFRQWWSLSAALLYLIFLVPFGAFLTGPLQDFTAAFVAHGLDALGIPNRVTQFQIEIPEGSFYVAEACAGLRFLIASIAFGALYAVTMFRSPWRRVVFIAVSCIVPVVANGFRGLGIVALGHVLGSAQAAAADHVLYGWIFFSIVIVLLALAGLPFRQDIVAAPDADAPRPAMPDPATGRMALLTILPVLAAAAAGPAVAAMIAHRAIPGGAAPALLVAAPGCTLIRASAQSAGPKSTVLLQSFRCGEATLTARTERLPVQANPATVTQAGTAWAASMVPGHDVDNRLLHTDGAFAMTWRLIMNEDGAHAAAATLFIDGAPSLGGLHDRLRLASHLLHGGGTSPVSIAVTVDGAVPDAPETLKTFLSGQGDLAQRVKAATE